MTSLKAILERSNSSLAGWTQRVLRSSSQALRVTAVALLALQPAMMSAVTPTPLRIITLQVLDANTARPVSADYVEVQCREGLSQCNTFHVIPDATAAARGELRVEVPMQATALIVNSTATHIQQCGSYDDAATVYRVSSIENDGLISPNECHDLSAHKLHALAAQPGRLVVFIHHKAVCRRQLPFC
ncbi:hypothetical protein SAMN05421819_2960 [Bryocella elongata]|uniref:Uncharacterized protein n=1 Tax=Bryocella elongata TaxID=863522 RepID=A0A1H6A7N0_9BACT|nr:hypothetical protein [Bryocella elongata]SEG44320.1 hypothetical protein SAMN05421819_2960 [Bryocella elongata]